MKYLLLALLCSGCAVMSVDDPEKIDPYGIRKTIRDSVMGQIHPCYEKLVAAEKQKNTNVSDLEGKIKIYFVVNPKGKAQNFQVTESTVKNKGVAECIHSAFKSAEFPIPPAGQEATVAYPFIFSTKD